MSIKNIYSNGQKLRKQVAFLITFTQSHLAKLFSLKYVYYYVLVVIYFFFFTDQFFIFMFIQFVSENLLLSYSNTKFNLYVENSKLILFLPTFIEFIRNIQNIILRENVKNWFTKKQKKSSTQS